MTLSTRILIGLIAGIASGLFFGEYCAFLSIAGDAFIGLLQMTVLPYIVVSLITNIGRLSAGEGRDMVMRGLAVLGLLLALGLGVLVVAPASFPAWESASFFSASLVVPPTATDLVALYIPSNPFGSMANNVVPAVVVFCIFVGVAIMAIPGKESLLRGLDVLVEALNRVNKLIVPLTPYGVFAIAASTAGTMTVDEIGRLQAFLLTYTAIVLVLGFVVIPALITGLTPFRYRDVFGVCRDTLITIFATGKIIIVLPQLIENVKELFRRQGLQSEASDAAAGVLMPLAYPFPNIGTVSILIFIPFSAWYLGNELSVGDVATYLGSGLISSFVAPVVSIPFVLDMMHIPLDMFHLFVVSTVYTDRIRVVLGALHLLALTIIATAALTGNLRVQKRKLLRGALLSLVAGAFAIAGVRVWLSYTLEGSYKTDTAFVEMELLGAPVPSRLFRDEPPPALEMIPKGGRLAAIERRGYLRVGYLRDRLPFAYMNSVAELVGMDIEMAHELARDLGVRLEFVRIEESQIGATLSNATTDIVMSGIMLDAEKVRTLTFSSSYLDETLAFVTRDHRRLEFSSREAVRRQDKPVIGVARSEAYWASKLKDYAPRAEIVMLDTPREYFKTRHEEVDALLYSAEAGSAWTLLYPSFTVVVPQPGVIQVPMAYVLPRGEPELVEFVNRWIELKKKDKTIDLLFEHWILGSGAGENKPRWSVIRDVLGWVE